MPASCVSCVSFNKVYQLKIFTSYHTTLFMELWKSSVDIHFDTNTVFNVMLLRNPLGIAIFFAFYCLSWCNVA